MSATPPESPHQSQAFTFVPATTIRRKLRMCLVGYEGTGKTYTALDTARALAGPAGRIAVIDTEGARRFANGTATSSSAIYARRFGGFDVLVLTDHTPENYIAAMEAAAAAGFDVIVIDSLSHEYIGASGLLELVDSLKAKGGYGWDVASMRHRRVFEAIIASPAHVIATMRQKKAYVTEQNGGRTRMRQVGTEAVQRDGAEFEFDLIFTIDAQHNATVSKSREMPDLPSGKTITRPRGELIAALALRSLAVGDAPPVTAPDVPAAPPITAGPVTATAPAPAASPAAAASNGAPAPAPADLVGAIPPEMRDELNRAVEAAGRVALKKAIVLRDSLGYRDWTNLYARGTASHGAALLEALRSTAPVPA